MLSQLIARQGEELRAIYRQSGPAIAAWTQRIVALEHSIYPRLRTCPLGHINLTGIDWTLLSTSLQTDFANPELMVAMACITSATILSLEAGDSFLPLERIRHWIRKLSILSSGGFGETMRAQLDDANKDLIIKVPLKGVSGEDLFHEMMVGLLATNNLRAYCPNFAYVYGGFSCSHPLVAANNEILTYCNTHQPIQYVIYENIQPATPGYQFLANLDRATYMNVILQLVFSLNLAWELYDFTHYDLHPPNVLMRDVKQTVSLKYKMGNETYYLNTTFIVTIIDYGFSHFKLPPGHKANPTNEELNLGYTGGLQIGVAPNKSFPMYDIFRFLVNTPRYTRSPAIVQLVDQISAFFGPEPISQVLKSGVYPFLPRTPEYERLTFLDFFNFLRSRFPNEINLTTNPTAQVLACLNEEQCPSTEKILTRLGVNNNKIPVDPFQFYDLYKTASSLPGNEQLVAYYLTTYDYKTGLQIIKDRVNEIHRVLTLYLSQPLPPSIFSKEAARRPNLAKYLDPNNMREYLLQLDNLGRILDQVQSYGQQQKVFNYLIKIQKEHLEATHWSYLGRNTVYMDPNWILPILPGLQNQLEIVAWDYMQLSKLNEPRLEPLTKKMVWYAELADNWMDYLDSLELPSLPRKMKV